MQGINPYYAGVTAGAQLFTGRPGALHLVAVTAAAATATVTVYNNTSATGNPLAVVSAPANQTAWLDFEGLPLPNSTLGLYIVVAGVGAQAMITAE